MTSIIANTVPALMCDPTTYIMLSIAPRRNHPGICLGFLSLPKQLYYGNIFLMCGLIG